MKIFNHYVFPDKGNILAHILHFSIIFLILSVRILFTLFIFADTVGLLILDKFVIFYGLNSEICIYY